MLYYIDNSCVESLNAGDPDAAEFLEQLILHRKKCKNLVIADRKVLHNLSQSPYLAPFARSLYKILANRSSEFRMILSRSKKYYKVVSACHGNKITENNGQVTIQLTMKEGNKTDFTDRSILLAESTDDIDFYKIIGNYYLNHHCIHHMSLSFEEMIGGGDTTNTRLEQILNEGRRLCLCIVDSDKKFSGATYGITLQKVMKILSKKGTENVEVYPLHTHEIENLIPVNMLHEICKDIPSAKTAISFLEFLLKIDASDCSPVFYFDYKKGLPKNKFILKKEATADEQKKFRRLENYRIYWMQYIKAFHLTIDSSADHLILPGISEKILPYAIKYLKSNKQLEKEIDQSYIQNLWLHLGAAIVTWGCVGHRIAA